MTAVTVVGTGTIGGMVASALAAGEVTGCTLVAAVSSADAAEQLPAAVVASDVVVEAASAACARDLIPLVVSLGKDVVVCSCGVFADPEFTATTTGTGRVLLPAGAIGGFDLLTAAVRADPAHAVVQHMMAKRPSALGESQDTDGPVEVFRGSARQAALRYPRTSNASVALALATVGLDRLEVVVLADPGAAETRHTVWCSSPVGTYEFSIHNTVDAGSGGRTSAITAWSVLETLVGLHRGVGPGVVVLPGVSHSSQRDRDGGR